METASESILDARPASPRDAFNGWFVTHEVAWELTMAALAVPYVALGFVAGEVPAGTALRSRRPSSS